MIYTTYFAKLKSLPEGIIPISICGKAPAGFKGLEFKKLAPKYSFFKQWKETGDSDYYIRCYIEQVLRSLQPSIIVEELYDLAYSAVEPGCVVKDIALVCYEKSDDFCHRHLVSSWLRDACWNCEEFKYN